MIYTATIEREPSTREGTFGEFYIRVDGGNGLTLSLLELPWHDNAVNVSCIPVGKYRCVMVNSPRYGWVYKILKVPGRTDILLHRGNWAGERDSELKSQVKGCCLPGMGRARGVPTPDRNGRQFTEAQAMVTNSVHALSVLYKFTKRAPFDLTIMEG